MPAILRGPIIEISTKTQIDSGKNPIVSGTNSRTIQQPPRPHLGFSAFGMSGKSTTEKLIDHRNNSLARYPQVVVGFHAAGTVHPVTVIGPESCQAFVKRTLELLTHSYYGLKMLEGIASYGHRVEVIHVDNYPPQCSEKHEDIFGKVNPGVSILGDFLSGLPAFHTHDIVSVKVDNSKFRHLLTPVQKRKGAYKKLIPEMILAHELFHAWQFTELSPSHRKGYFPRTGGFSYPKGRNGKLEAHALRYTNQIRIDLGIGYVRTQYKSGGHRIYIDTASDAVKRWKARKPVGK